MDLFTPRFSRPLAMSIADWFTSQSKFTQAIHCYGPIKLQHVQQCRLWLQLVPDAALAGGWKPS